MVPIPRKFVHGIPAPVVAPRPGNAIATRARLTLPPRANSGTGIAAGQQVTYQATSHDASYQATALRRSTGNNAWTIQLTGGGVKDVPDAEAWRLTPQKAGQSPSTGPTRSRKTSPLTGLAVLKAVFEAGEAKERVGNVDLKASKNLAALSPREKATGENMPSSSKASPNTPKPLPALPSTWAHEYEVVPEMSVIGTGAYGTVFQVRHKATLQLFACKVIQTQFMEVRGMGAQLKAEIDILQCASVSCRVAKLFAAAEENGCVFLLLELCPFGTLEHELSAQASGHLDEARAAHCARQMLQGLMDVHSMGILHRDIKLDNLLVAADGSVKLADFGWGTSAQSKPSGIAGTFSTMAPEVLRDEPQTTAVDLWSAGVCIFQLVTGRPFLTANIGAGATQLSNCDPNAATRVRQQILLDEISRTCPLRHSARPSHVSPACWDLLGKLLEPSAEKRWTASEALQHEWLQASQAQQDDVEGAFKAIDENVLDLSQTGTTISGSSSTQSLSSANPSLTDDAASQFVVMKQMLPEVMEQVVATKVWSKFRHYPKSWRKKPWVERLPTIPQMQNVEQIADAPRIQAFEEIVSVPLLEQVRDNPKMVEAPFEEMARDLRLDIERCASILRACAKLLPTEH